jgi:hypothetical protein
LWRSDFRSGSASRYAMRSFSVHRLSVYHFSFACVYVYLFTVLFPRKLGKI